MHAPVALTIYVHIKIQFIIRLTPHAVASVYSYLNTIEYLVSIKMYEWVADNLAPLNMIFISLLA